MLQSAEIITDDRLPGYEFIILPQYKGELRKDGKMIRTFDHSKVNDSLLSNTFVAGYFEALLDSAVK